MERASYASRSSGELASGISSGGRLVRVIPLRHPPDTSSRGSSSSSLSWWQAAVGKARGMGSLEWVEAALPCVGWMRRYRWTDDLQADLAAGITVGVMLVPQAMSYAKLAGLHPIYGLYTGFVPLFVYAIFGSSRQLAVGPVALVSLLVSNVLGGIVNPSSELYTELAILLAFMVGILECLMGLLRLEDVICGDTLLTRKYRKILPNGNIQDKHKQTLFLCNNLFQFLSSYSYFLPRTIFFPLWISCSIIILHRNSDRSTLEMVIWLLVC